MVSVRIFAKNNGSVGQANTLHSGHGVGASPMGASAPST